MLLDIQNLSVEVGAGASAKKIVDDVGLSVDTNEIVALVGGSGSGKTTTGLAVLRLLDPPLRIARGKVFLEGEDLLSCDKERMRRLRGASVSMVFQDPLSCLNPVFTIGFQVEEVLRFHTELPVRQIRPRTLELLSQAGIPEPRRILQSYPHQLSGGLRQRAMIALAMAAGPRLIIADEPTSNLDVTLQARIMDLFRRLRTETGVSVLLITHDLGVVRYLCDRIYVMTGGKIVESGAVRDVLNAPGHPYTRQLMEAVTV